MEAITYVIDTREQRPYDLQPAIRKALPTGDYSVAGHESEIAIERKQLTDLLGCLSGSRERFVRECERLAGYQYAAIVVESTFDDFLRDRRSRMEYNSRLGSIAAVSERYHIAVWFAGNRVAGQKLTERLLTRWARDKAVPPAACKIPA